MLVASGLYKSFMLFFVGILDLIFVGNYEIKIVNILEAEIFTMIVIHIKIRPFIYFFIFKHGKKKELLSYLSCRRGSFRISRMVRLNQNDNHGLTENGKNKFI